MTTLHERRKAHLTTAAVFLVWAPVCVVGIAVYGSFRPEGTAVDLVVAWGLVVLGFVFLSLGAYNLRRWTDER